MTAPLEPVEETFTVAGGASAARAVRELVRPRVAPHVSDDGAYDVELLVGELVANAVRHGGADESAMLEVELRVDGSELRLSVSDPGPGFERPAQAVARESGGGHGFVILDRLASDWGVDRGPRTRVWFAYSDAA